jgi:hypothetical protein
MSRRSRPRRIHRRFRAPDEIARTLSPQSDITIQSTGFRQHPIALSWRSKPIC